MHINLIDLEASGLHFDSWPLEVAMLAGGKLFSHLIKPEANWQYWSDDAEKLHGISLQYLHEQGQPVRSVALALNLAAQNTNGLFYSDAAPWDEDWLNTLFSAAGVMREFHILSLQDLLAEMNLTLAFERAKEACKGDFRQHRAAQDVLWLARAWEMVQA